MKKRLTLFMACFFAIQAFAQTENEDNRTANIDWTEDSTEVITIKDIVNQQQKVSVSHDIERHFLDVWGRRSYLNVSYNSTTLSPKGTVPTGVNNGTVKDMKSDWGLSLQYGRSYRLHKTPVSNILQFCIDYTGIDLNVNHFKSVGDPKGLYDSRNKIEVKQDYKTTSYFYTPWNMEKYEFNFGMSLGPSVTIAPFTSSDNRGLHYLKFNAFYHIGYHISLLYMPNDKDADLNDGSDITYTSKKDKEDMAENLKMEWGHGLIHSFGFNISWKVIGIGYEYRMASLKYKSMNTSSYGSEKYDFKSSTNRIYIQFRM